MTLPMAEGPRDGDFARYVEQLTGGTPQPGTLPPAPGASGAQSKAVRAASAVARNGAKSTGKSTARAAAKGGSAGADNAAARLKLQTTVAAAMVVLTLVFMPRLIIPALVFAGALVVSALIRWMGANKGS